MFDLHTHTRHSPDAGASMEAMARAALAAGLEGVAFTDHLEWMPRDDAAGYLKPAAYFAELASLRASCRGEITLLAGLEVGSSHHFLPQARAALSAWPWDYVLGSVHWSGGRLGYDPETFADGIAAAYERYFQEVRLLAEGGEYDVLAHFDLMRRDSWSTVGACLPAEPYAELIRAALRAVIERGRGLEINTSPWSKGMDEPCPAVTILRWYRELGGEVLVFGSDAHCPEAVGQHFARARDLALSLGFTRLARFAQRRVVGWIPL